MKLRNLLSAVMLSVVFGLGASSVFAFSANESFSTPSIKRQTNVVKSYFTTKAAAVRSVNSATRRGYQARMFYNGSMRRWVVEINYLGSNNSRNNSGNTSGNNTGSAIGEGCETALRSAETLYFPSRSMAEDIYKAHLRQGDCAKIWNAGNKGWAVAVKAITGRGLRPNRRSRSEIKSLDTVKSNQVTVAGGINSIKTRTEKAGGINSIKTRTNSKTGGINSIRAGVIRPSKVGVTRPSRKSVV